MISLVPILIDLLTIPLALDADLALEIEDRSQLMVVKGTIRAIEDTKNKNPVT